MTDIMDWNKCKEKFIREVSVDNEKIKSILETVNRRLELTKKIISIIKVDDKNVSFIVEDYYEIIKELLVALLLKKGLRSKNHQCLISYFYKNYPDYEAEINLISQMCFLRNRLEYYGELIESEFYNKNKNEFEKIIKFLFKLVKGEKL